MKTFRRYFVQLFTLIFAWTTFLLASCSTNGDFGELPLDQGVGRFPQFVSLNSQWEFSRLPKNWGVVGIDQFDVLEWEEVSIPHTARVEPRIVNEQWQGEMIYRKELFADPSWQGKIAIMRFEGAMNEADVWLNGIHVRKHFGGYLPFSVDLTPYLKIGSVNEIVVKLDNRDNAVTGPKPLRQLDFNMYGGLYREVNLVITNSLHITDEILANEVAGGGIFVWYPEVSEKQARVAIKTHIQNSAASEQGYRIRHDLLLGGKLSASTIGGGTVIPAGHRSYDNQEIFVSNPDLWSPESPALYRLVTTVETKRGIVDRRETQIGIRSFKFVNNDLYINGNRRFLRGVNRHQEYPYVGYAISTQADFRDAKLIKEAGFDYVRLSHYPHSKSFMEAADRYGLVLLDAILGWQYFSPDAAFRDHVVQTCRDMIRRDRNHPSVLAWECSLNETHMPEEFIGELHKTVHEEYPGGRVYSAGWLPDGYDIFIQSRQHRLLYPEIEIPADKPYIVSEYGDWEYYAQNAGFNQQNWANLADEARTSRQLLKHGEIRLLQQATNVQEAHNDNYSTPAFADGYWVMFDYNRGYADDLEASGLMSIERIAKPAYHFFRSQRDSNESSTLFNSGAMAHIANEWGDHSPTDVRVFSNGEEVELFLNGVSRGRQRPDRDRLSTNLRHPPFTFSLGEFEPGILEAIAYDGSDEVARHSVRTPGQPQDVDVNLAMVGIEAEKNDLLFLHARVVDEHGTRVPISGAFVEFSLGPGLLEVGPLLVQSENGFAATLVRVLDENVALSATATFRLAEDQAVAVTSARH